MLDEMKRSFEPLLREYPSAASVQDHLVAKMFDCEPGTIVVGNGAAELIGALGLETTGLRVAVPVPTFEEYLKRFPGSDVIEFASSDPDLRPDLERYQAIADQTDIVVLINPDNPSGQCLPTEDVLALAAHMEGSGKRLILDESFVDFAEPEHCTSLLRPDVLDAYPHLVIIKSISKSYGVPGARLGVLATADHDLLSRLRPHRTVWNINSFGEYFLQIIGKYQDRYVASCVEIRAERTRFFTLLNNIPGIRVLPSHANYFLCELEPPGSATKLAAALLRDHGILIKDASMKPGLDGREYVRIAVKGAADNDVLVAAVHVVLSEPGSADG
jgi:histidinol-phosphate/aromatic aminotransferase/cobyric acid decarboxylase-like protein